MEFSNPSHDSFPVEYNVFDFDSEIRIEDTDVAAERSEEIDTSIIGIPDDRGLTYASHDPSEESAEDRPPAPAHDTTHDEFHTDFEEAAESEKPPAAESGTPPIKPPDDSDVLASPEGPDDGRSTGDTDGSTSNDLMQSVPAGIFIPPSQKVSGLYDLEDMAEPPEKPANHDDVELDESDASPHPQQSPAVEPPLAADEVASVDEQDPVEPTVLPGDNKPSEPDRLIIIDMHKGEMGGAKGEFIKELLERLREELPPPTPLISQEFLKDRLDKYIEKMMAEKTASIEPPSFDPDRIQKIIDEQVGDSPFSPLPIQQEFEERYQAAEREYQRLVDSGQPIPESLLTAMRSIRISHQSLTYSDGKPFSERPINNVIASMDTLRANPLLPPTPAASLRPKVFAYLRDQHGATTAAEAVEAVRTGRVSREIVELWIDEGAVGITWLDKAMIAAYPDLAGKLKAAQERHQEAFRRGLAERFGKLFGDR